MGDFDPCECIWNHEHAMQRLINMLRNSQDACTDNECLTSPFGPQSADPANPSSGMTMMMIMLLWLVAATVLFLMRPSSLRQRQPDRKDRPDGPSGSGSDSHPPPPVPPVN